jgi:hypothetical protein
MTTTIEMTITLGETTPGESVSCRTVVESETDAEEIGEAIAIVVIGTQSARQLLALAHAVYVLSAGESDSDKYPEDNAFIEAAWRMMDKWNERDYELDLLVRQLPK